MGKVLEAKSCQTFSNKAKIYPYIFMNLATNHCMYLKTTRVKAFFWTLILKDCEGLEH